MSQKLTICPSVPPLLAPYLVFGFPFSRSALFIRVHIWSAMLGQRLAALSQLQLCELELRLCSLLMSRSHLCRGVHVYRLPTSKRKKRTEQSFDYANASPCIFFNSFISYGQFWIHLIISSYGYKYYENIILMFYCAIFLIWH